MSQKDADIVRRKLLNLFTCPMCGKDFHGKDMHKVMSSNGPIREEIIYSCKPCLHVDIRKLSEEIRASNARQGR